MNVLVIGSGGREHALLWKIHNSKKLKKLFAIPGNAGTRIIAENVNLSVNDFSAIAKFVEQNNIRFLVVGPEQPLVDGIFDYFIDKDVFVIGPSKAAAQLEGSKAFAKAFMKKYGIPTASYKSFNFSQIKDAYKFLEILEPPYVLKVSGLAAGKGVLILDDLQKAKSELKSIFEGRFGQAGETVIIEQFLRGIELSVFIVFDGKNYKILPTSKDYKKINEGDTGPNTGGMGAISPIPIADNIFMQKVEDKIISPTIEGIINEGFFYRGFLYFGLMVVDGEPFVLEYNVRLGDPETQVVLPRIKNDILDLFEAMVYQEIDKLEIEEDKRVAATVVLASQGYPGKYEKGKLITGLENVNNVIVFHSGTSLSADGIITNGGRVLSITALNNSLEQALEQIYTEIEKINFNGKYFRKDIGYEFLKK